MIKTEIMKRYEAETGRKPKDLFMGSEEFLIHFTCEYVEWLEAQLTWRDATKEVPPINQDVLFKINKSATPLVWRFDGEWWRTDIGGFTKAKDGNYWLPIPKEATDD